MHRIDTPTAQVDKFGAGKNGFTRGNPQTGVPATALDDDYFDAVQEEIAKVIESTGVALNKNNRAQLLAAIQHLITQGIPDLKDASLSQKGVVQLSNATNSTSQTLAATPKAVSDLGALLLKIGNNLSEIKDAGPAAVAQTLLNLGLGDAAKKGIASNAEMQVGTADKLVSLVGLMSVFGKRTFSENDYIRIPDVPGGLIIQWMKINNFPANTFQTVSLPTAMPHQLLNVVSTMYYGTISVSAEANARVTDFTLTNFRAAAGLSYTTSQTFIAIGY
ncbi:tail fiber protein [Yersinia bercovieri]|uniref:tail fiber protein n=1 Tax=Yersinia bercovieri TaxID=634 RepID=UPI00119F1313|nr:phage tail protein [Yersinia bercovieri]